MQSVGSFMSAHSLTELMRSDSLSMSTSSASAMAWAPVFRGTTTVFFAAKIFCSSCAVFEGSKSDDMLCFAAATPTNGRPRSMQTRKRTVAAQGHVAQSNEHSTTEARNCALAMFSTIIQNNSSSLPQLPALTALEILQAIVNGRQNQARLPGAREITSS